MTDEEFYHDKLVVLKHAEQYVLDLVDDCHKSLTSVSPYAPVLFFRSRIKSADSMVKKLRSRGFDITYMSALTNVYDAVGIRVICGLVDDVYLVSRWIEDSDGLEIIQKKDYIANPKPNGYRSLHLCVRIAHGEAKGVFAEIQLRTMAIDFWATLEHQLKYKKKVKNESFIRAELRRCADEIAATDISMQTIKDMIENEF